MDKLRRNFDLLIVGSGVAGLSAAVTAADKGLNVAVLSKAVDPAECNTRYAQGGIVGAAPDDTPDKLMQDIRSAGDGVNREEAIELVARKGPGMVTDFLVGRVGVPFCQESDGNWELTREAAHSMRRILHMKDRTGEGIETALLETVRSLPAVTLFSSHTAIDLITNTHNSASPQEKYRSTRVVGAYAYDETIRSVRAFFAPAVILAAGGVGNLFLHTSNPEAATGDGVAMAYRVGAAILNAEYVQFHPTILSHRDFKRFLISEAMRGEGARLINRKGEYFMERYEPEMKDLAPRDRVTRAIYKEMELEDSSYVRLDTSTIRNIDIAERFPQIYQQCREGGMDIAHQPIPVVPAAHYFCGGIKVDLHGRTEIPGLYAAGENACTGVHGANRLASVSLLEGLVWGIRSAEHIAANHRDLPRGLVADIRDWENPKEMMDADPLLIAQDFNTIKSTMWNYAGIVRTPKRLERAYSDLGYLRHRIERFYRDAYLSRSLIELRNSVITAVVIVRSAMGNGQSRGCHYLEK